MGGYGSGRTGNKHKAEHCPSLDVNKMRRDGCLEPGWSGQWVWSRNGQETSRISSHAEQGSIILSYSVRQNGSDWEPITQTVNTTQSDCNYGGQRTYFLCPGVVNRRHCGRRVGKLFSGGRYFLCRHCYPIGYSSQSEAHYDRMLRRANKLRTALGGEPGTAHWIAHKPKGMWQRTYQRKRSEIQWCEDQADRHFIAKFGHLLSSAEHEMYFGER